LKKENSNREPVATSHLKLPCKFDKGKLLRELQLTLDINWIPHFNKVDYDGEWDSIPLLAPNGDPSNIYALPNQTAPILPTPILNICAYFKEVLDYFECPLQTARLLRLRPGARIKPHTDFDLGYEDGSFRLHLPIITNDQIKFMINGQLLKMLPGECWYTNVNYEHAVENNGDTDRVHLVIDGCRNEWSDNLFFSVAPKEELLAQPKEKLSREAIIERIWHLEKINEPASVALLRDLKLQLESMSET
jgi:hypothetical protein